jgi:hypothetical protein
VDDGKYVVDDRESNVYEACPLSQAVEPEFHDDDVRPALFTMSSIVVGVGTLKVAVSPPISNLNMVP